VLSVLSKSAARPFEVFELMFVASTGIVSYRIVSYRVVSRNDHAADSLNDDNSQQNDGQISDRWAIRQIGYCKCRSHDERVFNVFNVQRVQCRAFQKLLVPLIDMRSIHCTLHTIHTTLYAIHYILYTMYYTLYNINYTLYSRQSAHRMAAAQQSVYALFSKHLKLAFKQGTN
jgi:hypothetical protein